MKYIPILFSTQMVQAILDDLKTQTRRVIKPQPDENGIQFIPTAPCLDWEQVYNDVWRPWLWDTEEGERIHKHCPYGELGDILWVRETLRQHGELGLEYVADNEWLSEEIIPNTYPSYRNYAHCNIPAIHMPKWACRVFLQVKSIRVERLQDIHEVDAKAEGAKKGIFRYGPNHLKNEFQLELNNHGFHYDGFKFIWLQINGFEIWKLNPWVWVIEFKRIDKPQNWPL